MNVRLDQMLSSIKNYTLRGYSSLQCPSSKLAKGVAETLVREGYLVSCSETEGTKRMLNIGLKYDSRGHSVIRTLRRVSKSSCRRFMKVRELYGFRSNTLGVLILSTSCGVLSDLEAIAKNASGEVMCEVR